MIMNENSGGGKDFKANNTVPDAEKEQIIPKKADLEDIISKLKGDSPNQERKTKGEQTTKPEENIASDNVLTEEELTSSPPQRDFAGIASKEDAA
jgi:hypothetical protein